MLDTDLILVLDLLYDHRNFELVLDHCPGPMSHLVLELVQWHEQLRLGVVIDLFVAGRESWNVKDIELAPLVHVV